MVIIGLYTNIKADGYLVELAWRSGSVMDCHATTRDSLPGGNGVKAQFHVLRKGQ